MAFGGTHSRLVTLAALPPGDHRHLRQEEHAAGGLLHPRAQVGPKLQRFSLKRGSSWWHRGCRAPLFPAWYPKDLGQGGRSEAERSRRGSASSSSLYLFKLGLAPQIQDLYGKVNFTGELHEALRSLCGMGGGNKEVLGASPKLSQSSLVLLGVCCAPRAHQGGSAAVWGRAVTPLLRSRGGDQQHAAGAGQVRPAAACLQQNRGHFGQRALGGRSSR